jgi:hypothetical protein
MLLALPAAAGGAKAVQAQSDVGRPLESDAAQPAQEAGPVPPLPPLESSGRFRPYRSESDDAYSAARDELERSLSRAGNYRTLCVRTCDGYYWPISNSAPRSKFRKDAETCETSCDMEARLFYLPRTSEDIAAMRDLSGRVYGRLPTAFAYRQSQSSGCTCKPEPWTEAGATRRRASSTSP